jgi:hypothetical protein
VVPHVHDLTLFHLIYANDTSCLSFDMSCKGQVFKIVIDRAKNNGLYIKVFFPVLIPCIDLMFSKLLYVLYQWFLKNIYINASLFRTRYESYQ